MTARLYYSTDKSFGNWFTVTRRFVLIRFHGLTLHISRSLSTVEG